MTRFRAHTHLLRLSALSLLSAALFSGCVERELVVESNPDGALVSMNDQELGRTPIRRDFNWYGTYDVLVEKEGYEPLRTKTPVIAPAWLWVPFDLVLEVLPFRIPDRHTIRYELKPTTEANVDPARMIRRGRELQGKLEVGEKTQFKPAITRPATTRPSTTQSTTRAISPSKP